jgi:uncharacterized protein
MGQDASAHRSSGAGPADSRRSPAHQAVEFQDLRALRDALDAGADVHEERDGMTLLHHAIDIELDSSNRPDVSLHVDTTAFLLARGADPTRKSHQGRGLSAEHMAFVSGHWLATELFEAWKRERGR